MPPLTAELASSISVHAASRRLPIGLVAAIVMTESAGNVDAWKVEPPYRYLYDVVGRRPFRVLTQAEIDSELAPRDFPHLPISGRNTEWWGQQASWGPMQVMGAVAREAGFVDHFPGLCSCQEGIAFGCAHLAQLRDRFLAKDSWPGVVAAYNAGSPRKTGDRYVNQDYVDRVRRFGGFDWEASA